jgi:2-(1,2-epoxy-1,2-dihydrophenyl)acetyl-CoA isomerase
LVNLVDGEMRLAIDQQDAVVVIRMTRERVRNALDPVQLDALATALTDAAQSGAGAVVLTGTGKAFCSGADLTAARGNDPQRLLRDHFNPLFQTIEDLQIPLVTAVNGVAIGAGLALALAGDAVLAASHAELVPRFVQIGFVPDAGATVHVTRRLGARAAATWLLTGTTWSASHALARGVVDEVAPVEQLLERSVALAQQLAAVPTVLRREVQALCANAERAEVSAQLEAEVVAQERNLADRARREAESTEKQAR